MIRVRLLAGAAALAAAAPVMAQQSVTINLTDVQIRHATEQSRSSAPATLAPAARYRYEISGSVRGLPAFSPVWFLYPNPVPLSQVLDTLAPGTSENLSGVVANPTGTHPFMISNETFEGSSTVGGVTATFAATISAGIDESDRVFFRISDVVVNPSSIGYFQFSSGTVVVTRIPCPANFDGGGMPGEVNSADISAFLAAWLADLSGGGDGTDYNLDGVVNSADISAFLSDWIATVTIGCPE